RHVGPGGWSGATRRGARGCRFYVPLARSARHGGARNGQKVAAGGLSGRAVTVRGGYFGLPKS
ncbi:hypothetical protein, partial [Komagataeibacter melaceti]|uniref:hypothetical protein n=1 Tax=Komagataeibacter melaceti TaxID=2766577 RepID=UPI0019D441DE